MTEPRYSIAQAREARAEANAIDQAAKDEWDRERRRLALTGLKSAMPPWSQARAWQKRPYLVAARTKVVK
jgi:hypothetical protein